MKKSFSDRLTPGQVQQVYDVLIPEWQDFYNPDNDGWVNMPHDNFNSDLSINILHGGFVDQYAAGHADPYCDGLPVRGDIVTLVTYLMFRPNEENKAIEWIKEILEMEPDMKSPVHLFHVNEAIEYGVNEAILLQGLRTWLEANMAKNRNIHEGRVWSYNKVEAFTNYHPYLSYWQIRNTLKKLEDSGKILTGNFNKHQYDQTKWYTINESQFFIKNTQKPAFNEN